MRIINRKKLITSLICWGAICGAAGFGCGILLSELIDILQEIEIASIGAVVGITGVILLACITRCLYELITWKCLRYKILKRDIVDLLKPTAFIIAFVVIYLITRYLGLHPLYFYGLFFGVFIVGIASLAKNLAKSRKKDQTYYYTFELIFFICLMVGLLVELIF